MGMADCLDSLYQIPILVEVVVGSSQVEDFPRLLHLVDLLDWDSYKEVSVAKEAMQRRRADLEEVVLQIPI
jgi:hypothetical protein